MPLLHPFRMNNEKPGAGLQVKNNVYGNVIVHTPAYDFTRNPLGIPKSTAPQPHRTGRM
jgi:hypothetical protein